MNDFTKEELEELWFFTELHKNKYRLKYPEELLNKIQSMIDNYPEPLPNCVPDKHDWEFVDHGSAGYYKCLVCQHSYNEQTRLAE